MSFSLSSSQISALVDLLIKLVPVVISVAPELYTEVKSGIDAVLEAGGATQDQVTALLAANATLDAQFDADVAVNEAGDS